MLGAFLVPVAVGAAVAYRYVSKARKPPFLLHLEYWVYLPGDALPAQDAVMTELVRPTVGAASVGPSEALLFSDVRLHIALVLRAKNGHVFRPDLLEPRVDATPDQLRLLEQAHSLAKVRFVSEEPVPDRRYLTFLPQVARVVAELGGGSLVYDPIGESLLTAESLRAGDPGPNVGWVAEPAGGHVRTYGLKKLGIAEIQTESVAADERWIVTEVIGQIARNAWTQGSLPPLAMAEAFDDRFQVSLVPKDGVAMARVHRIQEI